MPTKEEKRELAEQRRNQALQDRKEAVEHIMGNTKNGVGSLNKSLPEIPEN